MACIKMLLIALLMPAAGTSNAVTKPATAVCNKQLAKVVAVTYSRYL